VKPYNSDEILQLATKGVNDYNKLGNLEDLTATTGRITLNENQLQSLLRNIFDQLARYIGTSNALMGLMKKDNQLEKLFSVGNFMQDLSDEERLAQLEAARHSGEMVYQNENLVVALLKDFPVFALLEPEERLKTEKAYLLQLFIQNATQAIQNAQLQEELMQREKLMVAGKALGMLMHDLRTPIFNIPQITDLLRADGANEEYLSLLDASSKQAQEILEDFLGFVREKPIDFEAVSLGEIIKQAIEYTNNRKTIAVVKIQLDYAQDLKLSGDPSKLKRLIMNLLSNAVDVLKDLTVSDPQIWVKAKAVGSDVEISIKDNGPGIPEKMIPDLFEPSTTKNKKKVRGSD
jgi:signal transduction histidine kinase